MAACREPGKRTVTSRSSAGPDLGQLGGSLLNAIDSPGFVPLALVVAFLAGATHACAPGHGKSLTAAFLVGAQGRHRDALLLGTVVAAMHTVSVVAVAVAWVTMSEVGSLDVEGMSEVLQIVAAVLVVAAGVVLVRRRTHSRGHHHHGAVQGRRPGLVLLGASGGLLPSPAAFLVLLTGIYGGRAGLALVLVLLFGVGMAVVLAGVGLAAVSGRDLLAHMSSSHGWLERVSRIGPAVAAWGVLLAGCVLSVLAIATTTGV